MLFRSAYWRTVHGRPLYIVAFGPRVNGGKPGSEPTLVISRSAPTVTVDSPKRRSPAIIVLIVVIGLGIAAIVIAGLMVAAYRMGSRSSNVNVTAVETSPTPRAPAVSKQPAQTPTPGIPAATTTPLGTPDTATTAEDATPISWNTTGTTFKDEVGMKYTFVCPPGGTPMTIWGSDVYTADSSVCTAAVHAGKITLEDGGQVTIEFVAGRQTYGATTRNGITSYNFGQFGRSYVFR